MTTNVMANIDCGNCIFPIDLDVKSRQFIFELKKTKELSQANFLDSRILSDAANTFSESNGDLEQESIPQAKQKGFIFHTSFCCSTLLARLFDLDGTSIAYKEPLVLRRLSDAKLCGNLEQSLVSTAAKLLFRQLPDTGSVIIKPTHVALNIADDLLASQPGTKAIIITSTLDKFLLSNIKKTKLSQEKVPELVERFMSASSLPSRLPTAAFEPPDLLCGVTLQWYAQKQILNDLCGGGFSDRYKIIHEDELLQDPNVVMAMCLEWLGWSLPGINLDAHIAEVMGKHSKSTSRNYDQQEKQHENDLLASKYMDEVAHALAWSSQYVQPYIR